MLLAAGCSSLPPSHARDVSCLVQPPVVSTAPSSSGNDTTWAGVPLGCVAVARVEITAIGRWRLDQTVETTPAFGVRLSDGVIEAPAGALPRERAAVLFWDETIVEGGSTVDSSAIHDAYVGPHVFYLQTAVPASNVVGAKGPFAVYVTGHGLRFEGFLLDACPRDVITPDQRTHRYDGIGLGDWSLNETGAQLRVQFGGRPGTPCEPAELKLTWLGLFARAADG